MSNELTKKLTKLLEDWSKLANTRGNFQRVLLKGSLRNRNGKSFLPSSSDIDLLFQFSDHVKWPSKRAEALRALIPELTKLEKLLADFNPHNDKAVIVSSCATTILEWELGINVLGDFKHASRTYAYDLLHQRTVAPLKLKTNKKTLLEYADELFVLRECHRYRKRFLEVSGEGDRKVKPFEGWSLFGPQISAAAEHLRMFEAKLISREQSQPASTVDVFNKVYGSKYMQKLLDQMMFHDKGLRDLAYDISARSDNRPLKPSISENEQLLLWEVLAYKAQERIRKKEQPISNKAPAEPNIKLLRGYPHDYGETLARAQRLWITGLALNRYYPKLFNYLEKVTCQGGTINAMLLSPKSDAIKYAMQQEFGLDGNIDTYKYLLNDSHERWRKLRQSYPKQVQIKTTDYPLTYGLDALGKV